MTQKKFSWLRQSKFSDPRVGYHVSHIIKGCQEKGGIGGDQEAGAAGGSDVMELFEILADVEQSDKPGQVCSLAKGTGSFLLCFAQAIGRLM